VPQSTRMCESGQVIAARIGREGAALRRQVFDQLDVFLAETQARHPQPCTEHAVEVFDGVAGELRVTDLLEREHAGIERQRAPCR